MMLAIDTSTQWMGLVIFDGQQVLYEKVWRTSRRHTVELTPAIQSALKECGLKADALKVVAAALGPGSFTSLRIGLAAAKGLSLALRIPLIGIPSLNITANGQSASTHPLICVLKAGRERLAAQRFLYEENGWKSDGDIFMATASELEEGISSRTLLAGEINAEDRRILERRWRNALIAPPQDNFRRPAILAALAWKRFEIGNFDDPASLAPIYLHTLGTPTE